jgi:hypothetical protein
MVELRSLDKLKHVLPNKNADMSVGAADTSVRATSGATSDCLEWPKSKKQQRYRTVGYLIPSCSKYVSYLLGS